MMEKAFRFNILKTHENKFTISDSPINLDVIKIRSEEQIILK